MLFLPLPLVDRGRVDIEWTCGFVLLATIPSLAFNLASAIWYHGLGEVSARDGLAKSIIPETHGIVGTPVRTTKTTPYIRLVF